MVDVVIMQTPEGALRCNECGEFVDDAMRHARQVHPCEYGEPDVMIVHPDDE
jgi:uncharacterized Zn finger protein